MAVHADLSNRFTGTTLETQLTVCVSRTVLRITGLVHKKKESVPILSVMSMLRAVSAFAFFFFLYIAFLDGRNLGFLLFSSNNLALN